MLYEIMDLIQHTINGKEELFSIFLLTLRNISNLVEC